MISYGLFLKNTFAPSIIPTISPLLWHTFVIIAAKYRFGNPSEYYNTINW